MDDHCEDANASGSREYKLRELIQFAHEKMPVPTLMQVVNESGIGWIFDANICSDEDWDLIKETLATGFNLFPTVGDYARLN